MCCPFCRRKDFLSQLHLENHVNTHFNTPSKPQSSTQPHSSQEYLDNLYAQELDRKERLALKTQVDTQNKASTSQEQLDSYYAQELERKEKLALKMQEEKEFNKLRVSDKVVLYTMKTNVH